MPPPESPDKTNISLTEKIAEPEALLDRKKTVFDKQHEQSIDKPAIADGSEKIPVLLSWLLLKITLYMMRQRTKNR